MNQRWHLHLLVFGACAAGLLAGVVLWLFDQPQRAAVCWFAGSVPAVISLLHGSFAALRRRELGVDVLALVSIGGALLLEQAFTAAVVATMLASGQLLERYAERRAGREITALLARAPRRAHRYRGDGIEDIDIADIAPGDRLLVRQGDVLPVDGEAASPGVLLDESALTGESLPVAHAQGALLRSGCVNAGDAFDLLASAPASASTYAGIVRLVEAAQRARAPAMRMVDRYAMWFVPLALALAGGAWWFSGDPLRALAVVVVATPCPLLLAVPVAIVSGISRAARHGILVKGGAALETLATARQLFFDKTGTLTSGKARLVAIDNPSGRDDAELLRLAASLEQASHHVIAAAVVAAARARGLALAVPADVREVPGAGLSGRVDGLQLAVGGAEHVAQVAELPDSARALLARSASEGAASVLVAIDGRYAGALLLADQLRLETPRALRQLRRAGISRIVMLTGDRRDVAEAIGIGLDVDEVLAEQTPDAKLRAITAARANSPVVMVGDGVNDAPALAAANAGVAMGARGASASAEAADIVLLADRLDRLPEALHIAHRTRAIALQSVFAGMGLSLLAMALAAAGLLAPAAGALVQEGIDVAVILNALRVLRIKPLRGARDGIDPAELARLDADHQLLAPLLDRLAALAARLPALPAAQALATLEALEAELREQLLPHESADDREVYPAIAEMLGGHDPLASMSRAHREIFRLHRRLAADLQVLRSTPDPASTLLELQRTLHALDAILRLHFAQEEEIYQSVAAG